jgi:5-oxoprolinase (ATP-hydrolysing) subunit A
MDLNCDLGEDPTLLERDLRLIALVTSVNIACGGHAGDEKTMRALAAAAAERGVRIGAHPSYPDREGFGRREMPMDLRELQECVRAQIFALGKVAREVGGELSHVKPHGALYHVCARDEGVARAVGAGALMWGKVGLVGPAGCAGELCGRVWREMGAQVIREAFADRRYEADGSLRARGAAGALIKDPREAAAQADRIVRGEVVATDGSVLWLEAETICIHGDTEGAEEIARAVAEVLRDREKQVH